MRFRSDVLVSAALAVGAVGCSSETTGDYFQVAALGRAALPQVNASGSVKHRALWAARSSPLIHEPASAWSGVESSLSEVLGSPEVGPRVVTKILVLLEQTQSVLSDAARAAFDDGTCTPTTAAPRLAWFDDVGAEPFFGSVRAWPLECDSVTPTGTHVRVGRSPLAAGDGCADPFTYYGVMSEGYEGPNLEAPERGDTVNVRVSLAASYSKCTGAVQVAFAQITEYSGGMRFGSRSELDGNANTHTFRTRTVKYDRGLTPEATFYERVMTSVGTGVSQTVEGTPARFVVSHRLSDNGRVGPDQVFCLAAGELPGQFVPATVPSAAGPVPDDSACAAHAAAFASVPAFSETDGPRTLFEVSVRDEPSLEPGP